MSRPRKSVLRGLRVLQFFPAWKGQQALRIEDWEGPNVQGNLSCTVTTVSWYILLSLTLEGYWTTEC